MRNKAKPNPLPAAYKKRKRVSKKYGQHPTTTKERLAKVFADKN